MNFMKPIFLLFFFTSLLFSNETISIDNSTFDKEILSKSEIFIDHTQKLSFDEIQKQIFVKNDLKSLSYGYSPKFTAWVKFTLKNNTNQTLYKTLEYGHSLTTTVELYEGKNVFKDGLFQLNFDKDSINPIFPITIEPNETKIYYLKANSSVTTLIVKLKLWDSKAYEKESFFHQMILGMFFASLGILAIYNFIVYFFTKDKNYLFYVLYMVGVINHQLWYTGFGNIYLFSQEFSNTGIYFAEFYVAFAIFMFALLVQSFLYLKQYKKFSKYYNIFLLIFPFLVTIVWYFELYSIRNMFSFSLLIISSFVLLYSIYKKNRQAYFVGFGWSIFIISVIFMYLSSIGVIDIFDNFKYFVEIGIVLEAIIFSIALADKIKILEQRKNEANMELILNQQCEKQRLEHQVKEKTKELQLAFEEKNLLLKELNHRVKNNMQTIISLIRLQTNEINDEEVKKIFATTHNRINAMSKLHELLYNQTDLYNINANIYLQSLIDELKSGFESDNIKIDFDIQTTIKTQDAVYCGLIVNELVTNSLKYAFKENSGNIEIKLVKQFDNYMLSVEDDGIGYDTTNTKINLGSTLVDILATKQLKGKIQKNTTKGVKVIIIWSDK